MASQPLTGINQQPLIFAQITHGISSPETIKARIVSSSRVIDIKSNMFLHLFYNKPYQRDQGYNHAVDQAYGFQVKSAPVSNVYRIDDILAAGESDVGDMKTTQIAEREFLTLSEDKTWNFKPSVRVADFFSNSLGVPIDCWTPCSRIAIARELEEADLIKYELQCGAGDRDACAMDAGELARALHDGDQMSFDKNGCVEDLMGNVELSILFVNANPDIQALDFRLRMRILPCRCPPVIVQVPSSDGTTLKYYRAKLAFDESSCSKYKYVLDDEITENEAKCLGYNVSGNIWQYPAIGSIEQVKASNKQDATQGDNILNMDKSVVLENELLSIDNLNELLQHTLDFLMGDFDDKNITTDSSQKLTVDGADTYIWNTGATTASITVTPDAAGEYEYSVIGFKNNCRQEKKMKVIVTDPEPVCAESLTLSVTDQDGYNLTDNNSGTGFEVKKAALLIFSVPNDGKFDSYEYKRSSPNTGGDVDPSIKLLNDPNKSQYDGTEKIYYHDIKDYASHLADANPLTFFVIGKRNGCADVTSPEIKITIIEPTVGDQHPGVYDVEGERIKNPEDFGNNRRDTRAWRKTGGTDTDPTFEWADPPVLTVSVDSTTIGEATVTVTGGTPFEDNKYMFDLEMNDVDDWTSTSFGAAVADEATDSKYTSGTTFTSIPSNVDLRFKVSDNAGNTAFSDQFRWDVDDLTLNLKVVGTDIRTTVSGGVPYGTVSTVHNIFGVPAAYHYTVKARENQDQAFIEEITLSGQNSWNWSGGIHIQKEQTFTEYEVTVTDRLGNSKTDTINIV